MPSGKIHSNLKERLRDRALSQAKTPLPILVLFRSGTDSVGAALKGIADIHRTYHLVTIIALSTSPRRIETLAENENVEMIWYDEPVHTMLDSSVPLVRAPRAWRHGITGKGVKVAVVDTGIDPRHPDLHNRIAQVKDFTSEGPADTNGHGTHVAGIIGGAGARYRGVAPECLIYSAKVLGADGTGLMSDVMAGLDWAVQQGVQVVNLSLGSDGPTDGTDGLAFICNAAVEQGVVICAAAGNAGPTTGIMGSPAGAKGVITVGATSKVDQLADFSSRGPTTDLRGKPDICFPGVDIVSCRAAGTLKGTPVDDLYTTCSGTSMAAAHASGACALLLQAYPDHCPSQIRSALLEAPRDLGLDSNLQGKGRADIYSALTSQPAPPPPPAPDPAPALAEPPPPERIEPDPKHRDRGRGNGWRDFIRTVIAGR